MLLTSSIKKRDEDRSTLSVLRRFDKNSKDIDLRVSLTISYLLELSRQVSEIQKIVEAERQILEDETDALEAAAKAKGINKEDVISEIRRLLEESDLTDIQSDIDTTITCLNVCQGCLGREETTDTTETCNQSGCGLTVSTTEPTTDETEDCQTNESTCDDACEYYLALESCHTICEYSLSCGTGECLQCDGNSEQTTRIICTQCNTDNCTSCDTDNCTGLSCDGEIDVKCTVTSELTCEDTFDGYSVTCDDEQRTCSVDLLIGCIFTGIGKPSCGTKQISEAGINDIKLCSSQGDDLIFNCADEYVNYSGCLISDDQIARCFGILSITQCGWKEAECGYNQHQDSDELILDGCSGTTNVSFLCTGSGNRYYCNPAISVCKSTGVSTTVVNQCGTAGTSTTETVNGEEYDCSGGVAITCDSTSVSAVCTTSISCNGVSQDTYNTVTCDGQSTEHTETTRETTTICTRCDGNSEQVTGVSSEDIDNWLNQCEIGLSDAVDACGPNFAGCVDFSKCSGGTFGTASGCGSGQGCGTCQDTTQCGTCQDTEQCTSCVGGTCQGGCQGTSQCGNCVSTCQTDAQQCPSCYGTTECSICDTGCNSTNQGACCQYAYRQCDCSQAIAQ